MPRRKDHTGRRRQLIQAAYVTLARKGSEGTRLADIAREAGVAPGLVSYYFPSKDDLLLEATRHCIDGFYAEREEAVASVEDPLEKLELAIRLALPESAEDRDWTILAEFWTRALRSVPLSTVAALFQARSRALYVSILEEGQASGRFSLAADAESVARSLIAMIEGLALQVVLRDPSLDVETMERLVIAYARQAVGESAGPVLP